MKKQKTQINPINYPDPEHVQLSGLLSERFSGNLNYLKAIYRTRREWMLEPFQNIGKDWVIPPLRNQKGELAWAGEYAGKWIEAAALTAVNTNEPILRQYVKEFTSALLATQQPDGYIGIETSAKRGQGWDVWNTWNVMIGLMTYYEHFNDESVLRATVKCGLRLIEHFGMITDSRNPFFSAAHDDICNSPIIGEFVRLYKFTKDQKFLDFAASILTHYPHLDTIRSTGIAPLIHVYHLTEFLAGVVDFAITANQQEVLRWVETAWKDMVDHHLYPTGSLGYREHLRETAPNDIAVEDGEPDKHHQETCGTVGWLLLNSRLYQATGKICYMQCIEQTLYNALLAAQSMDGMCWMYYTPLRYEKRWFSGPTSCCYWSGPRGISRMVDWIYAYSEEGIFINLYETSQATFNISGHVISVNQSSLYPYIGHIEIQMQPEKPCPFTLWIRIPFQSTETKIVINGTDYPVQPVQNGYLPIHRVWTTGDQVVMEFDLPVVVNHFMNDHNGVVVRGPEVLAIDQRDNPTVDLDSVVINLDIRLKRFDPLEGRRRYSGDVKFDGKVEQILFTPYADAGGNGARFRTAFPIENSDA